MGKSIPSPSLLIDILTYEPKGKCTVPDKSKIKNKNFLLSNHSMWWRLLYNQVHMAFLKAFSLFKALKVCLRVKVGVVLLEEQPVSFNIQSLNIKFKL